MEKQVLTKEEFCKELTRRGLPLTVRTLNDWIRRGWVQVVQPGKKVFIPVSEVDRLLTPRGD